MLNNQEPIRKMSKLVLPEPQISDQVIIYSCIINIFKINYELYFKGIATSC